MAVHEVNFENFGFREVEEAISLLKLWKADKFSKLARDMFDTQTSPKVCFNDESGYVFLMDEDYNVVMELKDTLVMHLVCHDCGYEDNEILFEPTKKCCQAIVKVIQESKK